MKNISNYKFFNEGRISNAIKSDIIKIKYNRTEFMMSIVNNDMSRFRELIKISDLEEIDKYGNTALMISCSEGRLSMVKMLLRYGANIHHKNKKGEDFYDMSLKDKSFFKSVKKYIENNYPEFVVSKKYNI